MRAGDFRSLRTPLTPDPSPPIRSGDFSKQTGAGEGNGAAQVADAARIVAIARAWLRTPYLHQASVKGQGTDCLGLIRGVWRELYGAEPEIAPPYTPDWTERGFARGEEPLLEAARRNLLRRESGIGNRESGGVCRDEAGTPASSECGASLQFSTRPIPDSRFPVPEPRPGDVLVFRIVAAGPAKHCGILTEEDRFIHAYAGRCVLESWYSRWWRERTAGVFAFPATVNRESGIGNRESGIGNRRGHDS